MKNVLITGGASGLGKCLVLEFAKMGYNVIFTYFSSDKEDVLNMLKDYNVSSLALYCDLSNEESIKNMLSKVKEYGFVDVLVNNAAVEIDKDFNMKEKSDFEKTLSVNLVAPFLISREIGNMMYERKSGVIINISSNNAFCMYDEITLEYDASKKALLSLTNNLAKYFSPYVRVNAIAPGFIKTQKIINLDKSLNGEFLKDAKEKTLLKELPEEVDIANVVLYLASDKSKFINNEVIRIDGGVL